MGKILRTHLNWLTLFVAALACYRLSVLLSDDSGPYRFIAKFRSFLKREEKHNKALKKSDVANGIECARCNSVWVAFPIALYAHNHSNWTGWWIDAIDVFLLCMALSALAILLNRALPPK